MPVPKEPEPVREAPEPLAQEPEPVVPAPVREPEPVVQAPVPEPEPVVHEPVREPEPVVQAPVPEPEPVVEPPVREPEPVVQARVEPVPQSAPAAIAAPPPPPTRPTPPRHRQRRDRKAEKLAPTRPRATAGSGRALGRIAALVALALIGLALYAINAIFQPFHADARGSVGVTIPAGADVDRIGGILAERDVIESGRAFALNATVTGRRGGLRPGRYTLPRQMSNGLAIEALTQGPKAKVIKTYELSIPEGRSIDETDERLAETSIDGGYARAARSQAALRRGRRLGLPRRSSTLEGYLFPATYTLPEGTTAPELVTRQLQGFADNTARVSYARARRSDLSRYEVLIIASMIEREAQLDRERRLVSAVIHNRLEQGIPLGIDATIRYATDNWTRPIRQSELEADGPFNSRLRRGLPPTPIGNPGLASIRAAANPARSDFLYYVVKPGSKGAHAFSETDAEFQRDVARYQSAREANQGQAP